MYVRWVQDRVTQRLEQKSVLTNYLDIGSELASWAFVVHDHKYKGQQLKAPNPTIVLNLGSSHQPVSEE